MLMRTSRVVVGAAPVPTVVVVGGDAIVGHALELLLRGSGYDARYEALQVFDARRALAKAGVVLLAPGLDDWGRDAVLAPIKAMCPYGTLPVLELTPPVAKVRPWEKHALLTWPCRTEDLEHEIEAALLRGRGCVEETKNQVQEERERR